MSHPIFTDANLVQVVTHFDNANKVLSIQHPTFIAMLSEDWQEAVDAYLFTDEFGTWIDQILVDQIASAAKVEFTSTAFIRFV